MITIDKTLQELEEIGRIANSLHVMQRILCGRACQLLQVADNESYEANLAREIVLVEGKDVCEVAASVQMYKANQQFAEAGNAYDDDYDVALDL